MAPSRDPGPVRIADPELAGAVRRALTRAEKKLQRPRCRQLVADLAGSPGPLRADALQRRGGRPEAALQKLMFYDGSSIPVCGRRQVLAATMPGARVVFICRSSFLRVARRDRTQLANLVLHELLHSQGLNEDPRGPQLISGMIARHCGH